MNIRNDQSRWATNFLYYFQIVLFIRALFEIVTIGMFIYVMGSKGWDGKSAFLLLVNLLWVLQAIIWFRLCSSARSKTLDAFLPIANKAILFSTLIEFFAFLTGSYRSVDSFDWASFQGSEVTLVNLYAHYQDFLFDFADMVTPIPHGLAAITGLSLLWVFSKRALK